MLYLLSLILVFEHLRSIKQDSTQDLNSQVGLAVLDIKDPVLSPPQIAISMYKYSFVTGSPSYCANAAKKFLFGKTNHDTLARYIYKPRTFDPTDAAYCSCWS